MSYAIPYLILLLILAMLAFSNNRLDKELRDRMWMGCGLLLLVFFGLRGYVGDDWVGYHVVYQSVQPKDFHLNIFGKHAFRFEPGFAILAYLCRLIAGGDGYLFFQFVVTLFQLILLFRFFRRYTQNLPFSLIIFLAMSGLVMLINTMRNTLAILIFLNGLHYISQRRFGRYLLICLMAMAFHMSSVLFIPLYFFLHKPIPRWLFILLFVIGNAIVLFKVPVLSVGVSAVADLIGGKLAYMVKSYLEDQHMAALSFSLSIGSLERLGTGLMVIIFWNKLKALRSENIVYINVLLLFFLFYFTFSEVREVGKRLSELFIYAYWILWPDMLLCFRRRFMRLTFGAFLCLYCSLKVVGTVGYPNTKYENILTGYTHYEQRVHEHRSEAIEVTKAQQGE